MSYLSVAFSAQNFLPSNTKQCLAANFNKRKEIVWTLERDFLHSPFTQPSLSLRDAVLNDNRSCMGTQEICTLSLTVVLHDMRHWSHFNNIVVSNKASK